MTTDPTSALQASQTGAALFDRSDWGHLWAQGEGILEFLHNQSTNDLKSLSPGQGCDTVFVTATAQILDLTTAYLTEAGVILITSPERREQLRTTLGQWIRFVRGSELIDKTTEMACFSLIGPASLSLMDGFSGLLHAHRLTEVKGIPVRVAVGSGLPGLGYTLLSERRHAGHLWQTLVAAGSVPAGPEAWEQLRVEQGRPAADRELTPTYNPLEAGLWRAISLSKGCYIGQEVLAKQVTYHRVRQQLWGIRLDGPAPVGSAISVAGDKMGTLTSLVEMGTTWIGLGYLRTKIDLYPGLAVELSDAEGVLETRPFLDYPPG